MIKIRRVLSCRTINKLAKNDEEPKPPIPTLSSAVDAPKTEASTEPSASPETSLPPVLPLLPVEYVNRPSLDFADSLLPTTRRRSCSLPPGSNGQTPLGDDDNGQPWRSSESWKRALARSSPTQSTSLISATSAPIDVPEADGPALPTSRTFPLFAPPAPFPTARASTTTHFATTYRRGHDGLRVEIEFCDPFQSGHATRLPPTPVSPTFGSTFPSPFPGGSRTYKGLSVVSAFSATTVSSAESECELDLLPLTPESVGSMLHSPSFSDINKTPISWGRKSSIVSSSSGLHAVEPPSPSTPLRRGTFGLGLEGMPSSPVTPTPAARQGLDAPPSRPARPASLDLSADAVIGREVYEDLPTPELDRSTMTSESSLLDTPAQYEDLTLPMTPPSPTLPLRLKVIRKPSRAGSHQKPVVSDSSRHQDGTHGSEGVHSSSVRRDKLYSHGWI